MTRKDSIPYLLKDQHWGTDLTPKRPEWRRFWKRLKSKWLRRRAAREAKP